MGAVTFLDVLGWKGIWTRVEDPIRRLKRLLELAETEAKNLSRGVAPSLSTEILSISDTIVLLTSAEPSQKHRALEIHGYICASLIPISIREGIPVRGATGYGDYSRSESIYAGRAIDEVASWHEASDWIGVHMCPSAHLSYQLQPQKDGPWCQCQVPFKHGSVRNHKSLAVDWVGSNPSMSVYELRQLLEQLGPIFPEFAAKIFNTLAFYEARATSEPQNSSV